MPVMAKPKHPVVFKLRAEMERRDLKHHEVAAQLGIGLSTLRSWLYGIKKPSKMAQRVIKSWIDNTI